MPKSWVTPGTATMIRDYLLEEGSSYVWQIHMYLKKEIENMGYHPPNYDSTRKMVYVLKRLGLVRTVRREKAKPNFPRRYYAVVRGMEDSPFWRNPQAALYNPEKFEEWGRLVGIPPEEWMKRVRKEKKEAGTKEARIRGQGRKPRYIVP